MVKPVRDLVDELGGDWRERDGGKAFEKLWLDELSVGEQEVHRQRTQRGCELPSLSS